LTNELLAEELELIQNAAFTDPNDQSVWFYHKWLVNAHLQNVPPVLTFAGHKSSDIYLVFNIDVPNPANSGFLVNMTLNTGATKAVDSPWRNLWVKPKCKVWMKKIDDAIARESVSNFSICTSPNWSIPKNFVNEDGDIIVKPEERITVNSLENDAFSTFLAKELQWVQELHDLEPENKWAILTLIHLLRLVDFRNNEETILELIETLKNLDHYRAQYYSDLRKKFMLEWDIIRQLELQPSVCPFLLPPF
jgi:geranylgeranyl transferase type-2 subunit alpha